uniref:Uncharacterized protein n=1 Tax=Oryza rufipogon TaxID=4529 RepID=A0A0E0N5H8_ORYRU
MVHLLTSPWIPIPRHIPRQHRSVSGCSESRSRHFPVHGRCSKLWTTPCSIFPKRTDRHNINRAKSQNLATKRAISSVAGFRLPRRQLSIRRNGNGKGKAVASEEKSA